MLSSGKRYRNIQGHRSQPDWPPNATPALWEDIGGSWSGGGGAPQYGQPQQPQQAQPPKWESAPQGTRAINYIDRQHWILIYQWYLIDWSKLGDMGSLLLASGSGHVEGGLRIPRSVRRCCADICVFRLQRKSKEAGKNWPENFFLERKCITIIYLLSHWYLTQLYCLFSILLQSMIFKVVSIYFTRTLQQKQFESLFR